MESLQAFIAFVRLEKKDDVLKTLFLAYQANGSKQVSLATTISTNDLHALLERSFLQLLSAIQKNDIDEYFRLQADGQKYTQTGFLDIVVSPRDMFFLLATQKKILVECIPAFTGDFSVAYKIVIALEEIIDKLQNAFVEAFDEIHQQATEEIEEKEQRFKDLFDNATDLIHFVHPDGTILYVNNAWQKGLGYSREESEGKSIYDFLAPVDLDKYRNLREDLLKGIVFNKETDFRFRTKDEKEIVLEGSLSTKTENGQALYTRGIFRNITARVESDKKIEYINEQLKQREETLTHLFTYAPEAIIVIDSESVIQYWNPRAEEVFGWQASEVIGKQLDGIIIPPSYRQAHALGMKRYLSTGVARVLNKTLEVTALNKSGKEFYISLTISNYQQKDRTGFISFIRNITDEKKNTLELERKRKQLDQSVKELEQYTWLTSHDLREPLRKILTYSDIILTQLAGDLSETVKRQVQKIHDSGKRMNELIQAILLYSSLANEQHLYTETDLNKIAKAALWELAPLINETNTTVKFEPLPVIEAVPFQMQQLFQNLVSNAIKYRKPDADPFINVTFKKAGSFAEIIFQDNGMGFEAKDKEKIFFLFQRLEASRAAESTGIGLALCKKIVEKHHGAIRVESTPGLGSDFVIHLPLTQEVL